MLTLPTIRLATLDACTARAARLRALLPGWTVALTGNGLRAKVTAPDGRHRACIDLVNLRPIGCTGCPSVPALAGVLREAWAACSPSTDAEVSDVR